MKKLLLAAALFVVNCYAGDETQDEFSVEGEEAQEIQLIFGKKIGKDGVPTACVVTFAEEIDETTEEEADDESGGDKGAMSRLAAASKQVKLARSIPKYALRPDVTGPQVPDNFIEKENAYSTKLLNSDWVELLNNPEINRDRIERYKQSLSKTRRGGISVSQQVLGKKKE